MAASSFDKVYKLADPMTGIVVSMWGWRLMCRTYKKLYGGVDMLEKKRRMIENGIPVYQRIVRTRGGSFWFNAAVNPYAE